MLFRYCEKYYSPASEDARDIFLYLLRVYLRPPEGVKPMLTPALRLLNKHFNRIDTPKVYAPKPRAMQRSDHRKALELLPPDVPISELYPFFENVLQQTSHNRKEAQVLKNLLKSENLQVAFNGFISASHTALRYEKSLSGVAPVPLPLKKIECVSFAASDWELAYSPATLTT